MKLKVDVKFDEKKAKNAIIKEAEKVAAERANTLNMQPRAQKINVITCKSCHTKFPSSVVGAITTCPRCKKPLF